MLRAVTRNELRAKALRFAVTRNELRARGGAMEDEMSVQRKLRGVTRKELTAPALRQSELTAKARNEACAAKANR